MAKKIITELVDDIDGSSAVETISFSLNGKAYLIDLSEANAKALHESFDEFIQFARPDQGDGGTRKNKTAMTRTDRERTTAIRSWAQANGHDVADRGRIPHEVVAAYDSRQLVNA